MSSLLCLVLIFITQLCESQQQTPPLCGNYTVSPGRQLTFYQSPYGLGSSCRYFVNTANYYNLTATCILSMDPKGIFYVSRDGDSLLRNGFFYNQYTPRFTVTSVGTRISLGYTTTGYDYRYRGSFQCTVSVPSNSYCDCGWFFQVIHESSFESHTESYLDIFRIKFIMAKMPVQVNSLPWLEFGAKLIRMCFVEGQSYTFNIY